MSPVRRLSASKPSVSRQGTARRRRRLLLEELETRALPSAGLSAIAQPESARLRSWNLASPSDTRRIKSGTPMDSI